MDVPLPPDLEQYVRDLVRSGRYASASEAVAAGLWLLLDREYVREGRLRWLQQAVEEGLASLEDGEGQDGEQVVLELRRKMARMRKAAPAKPRR